MVSLRESASEICSNEEFLLFSKNFCAHLVSFSVSKYIPTIHSSFFVNFRKMKFTARKKTFKAKHEVLYLNEKINFHEKYSNKSGQAILTSGRFIFLNHSATNLILMQTKKMRLVKKKKHIFLHREPQTGNRHAKLIFKIYTITIIPH